MVKEKMARAMIEPLVNRTISDIQKDPERSLRNIIDLLLSFPNGRFSSNLLEIAQRMLTNEKSAYYPLIKKVVSYVDMQNFKDFSMNIGYNAYTSGAKHIRQNMDTYDCKIPWLIYVQCNDADSVAKLITDGKKLGIYAYTIASNNSVSKEMFEIYKKEADCAFILLTEAGQIEDKVLGDYESVSNTLIAVCADNENCKAGIELLKKHKRFFGTYLHYNNDNATDIFKPERLKELEGHTASFVFCLPTRVCRKETLEYVRANAKKIRDEQKYSYVMVDAYDDALFIDSMISGNNAAFAMRDDGTIISSDLGVEGKDLNIQNTPLIDIFKCFKR